LAFPGQNLEFLGRFTSSPVPPRASSPDGPAPPLSRPAHPGISPSAPAGRPGPRHGPATQAARLLWQPGWAFVLAAQLSRRLGWADIGQAGRSSSPPGRALPVRPGPGCAEAGHAGCSAPAWAASGRCWPASAASDQPPRRYENSSMCRLTLRSFPLSKNQLSVTSLFL
jgi:hypothetical protein